MTTPSADRPEAHDVVGIGFGPSNLALAVAVHERAAQGGAPVTAHFLERQAAFGWHRGMLLEDATMQVAFLKDLATMRNPTSDFSFVCFLHEQGRLVDFINHKTQYPLRVEFHQYLEWAAARLDAMVSYGREVTDVRPVTDEGGTVVAFDVHSRDLDRRASPVVRARNVVAAPGLRPTLPVGVEAGPRVWHTRDLLFRVPTLGDPAEIRRVVVVGSGQSAAEAVAFLHDHLRDAEVLSVFTRYGYAPADDSSFANRIFDPEAVDVYFGADDGVRSRLTAYHRNTNYSVVDGDLIDELYRRTYREKVLGRRRLQILNTTAVVGQKVEADRVVLTVEDLPTGRVHEIEADAVVYATGYRPVDVVELLGTAGTLVRRTDDGDPQVTRDHRLVLDRPATARAYLQGGTEHSHGLSSTLLSNVAVRAGEVLASVCSVGDEGRPEVDRDLARRRRREHQEVTPVTGSARPMVEVEDLGRSYGDTRALDGIDLLVPEGEVLALLGPNGAGKTTTVEILATLRAPDRGRARVAGHDVVTEAEAVRRSIALTGQFAAVDEDLTGEENLVVFGRLLGRSRRDARARAGDLLARFDLVEAAATRVRDYSGGMRRRLDLAASLVVEPLVLFLDEPTTGLDPRSRRSLWAEVKGLRDQGVTVLLTTQYLEEADVLADRIVVIDRGRVVAEGPPEALKEGAGGTRCEVAPLDPVDLDRAVAALADLGPVVDAETGHVSIPAAEGVAVLTAAVRRLDDAGVEVADISLRTPSLDDVFLALTGADGAPTAAVHP